MTLQQLLLEFRTGKLDQARLLARSEELLNAGGDNLDSILAELQETHARSPLPLGALVALRKHLAAAAAPKTEILNDPQTAALLNSAAPTEPRSSPATAEETVAKQALGATLAGRFKLVEFIGSGGTSRLYKAIDQRKVEAGADDKHVAVKVLTYPFKDTLEALSVLHRETEGTQKLTHPNIVRVIDCDRDGDTVFMTMEFIGGKTLHALMRTSRFLGAGRGEALSIVRDIATAIDYAHSKSIVHGDLTPGNVMIALNGGAKVIDFGIARVFGQARGASTTASGRSHSRGEITGFSPTYASPEAIEQREPDPRDDIYSLACMTWELLTGKHPFGRTNAKAARDAGMALEYSDKLSRVEYSALVQALHFDRAQRTPSVKEFVDALTMSKPNRATPLLAASAAALAIALGAFFYFTREVPPQAAPTPIAQAPAPSAPPTPVPVPAPAAATEPAAVGTVFRDCPTCPLMLVLPAGEFMQGSVTGASEATPYEMPQHRVQLASNFAASRTEVTVGEYAEFSQATGRETKGCMTYDGDWKLREDAYWKNAIVQQTALHPVSCVSWEDANEYAKWLSTRTKQKYRLPTASEWEYSARAGSTTDRPWSTDTNACGIGNVADQGAARRFPGWTVHNCNDAFVQAAPVGSFAANAFGLHDMLGNVFEWVADCWIDNYDGAPSDGSSHQSSNCSQRELRGGSWFTAPNLVRFAYRNRFAHDYRSSSVGFRIVREITP